MHSQKKGERSIEMKANNSANEKSKLITCMCHDLIESIEKFLKDPPTPGEKQNSKTSIKRKITYLRQELLALGKIMDGDD